MIADLTQFKELWGATNTSSRLHLLASTWVVVLSDDF
jgi:hypothetical protein